MAVRRVSYEMLTERPFREKLFLGAAPFKTFVRKFSRPETVLPHHHPEFEIIFPKGIKGETVVPGGRHALSEGRVHCIPGGMVHAFKLIPDRESEVRVLQINAGLLGEAENEGWIKRFSVLTKIHSDRASALAAALENSAADGMIPASDQGRAFEKLSDLYALLALVAHESPLPAVGGRAEAKVRRVIDVLEGLAHRPVSLDEISRRCSLSKFHLCRSFKASTGMTLTGYLNRLRVERAMHLMGEVGKNTTEACYDCGFENPSYFIQVFSKIVDETPKQWALKQAFTR